jgi:hypothetical protein
MLKQLVSLSLMSCSIHMSVLAAGSQAQGPTNSSKPTKSVPARLANVPVCAAGFCTGFVVGTPVCFARKLKQEVSEGAHGLVGSIVTDNNNPALLVPAGIFWFPAAMFVAGMEAPAYAWRDAWMADKPFSKEQFSLGNLDEDK